MANVVNALEIQDMVTHWLSTPPNGYLGSDYGSGLQELLQTPLSSGMADRLIDKLLIDVPVLGALPSGTVNMYMEQKGNDRANLFITVYDSMIPVGEVPL